MFAKLLKYEWKASFRLLLLLGGCVLGLGCLAAVVLRLLTTYWDQFFVREELALVLIPAFTFLFFAFLAISLYGACTQYILLFRFYKSRFTDEGYLMFTLPVKTSQIFLSTAVHILIWNVITSLVTVCAFAIAAVIGPLWSDEAIREVHMAFADISDTFTQGYGASTIVSMIVMSVYGIIAPMTAVVLGASVAKKHKVITIIAFIIAISMVTGTLNGIVSGIMQFLLFAAEDSIDLITTLTPIASSIFPLLATVGGYILSIHLMRKRLNLP